MDEITWIVAFRDKNTHEIVGPLWFFDEWNWHPKRPPVRWAKGACYDSCEYCVMAGQGYGYDKGVPDSVLQRQEWYDKPKKETKMDWKAIEAQAQADLDTVQTDKDAYAFIEKYLSKDLQGRYLQIYRSDRHEMNCTPRQALDNILSLPPIE